VVEADLNFELQIRFRVGVWSSRGDVWSRRGECRWIEGEAWWSLPVVMMIGGRRRRKAFDFF